MSEDVNIPRRNGQVVQTIQQEVWQGKHTLKELPGLIAVMLREEMWKERLVPATKEVVTFERFEQFVTTPPVEGLGATMDIIKKICAEDKAVLDLIVQEEIGQHGGDRRSEEFKVLNTNVEKEDKRKSSDNAEYALRRLRKDAPELHQRVLSGDLSPHAAMVEAGFRKKTITVPAEVEQAAEALKRHFTDAELHCIARLISPSMPISDTTTYPLDIFFRSPDKPAEKPQKRFVKPTLEEVTAYMTEIGIGHLAEQWLDHYEANGWRVGKVPMKDWRAACRTWRNSEFNTPAPVPPKETPKPAARPVPIAETPFDSNHQPVPMPDDVRKKLRNIGLSFPE